MVLAVGQTLTKFQSTLPLRGATQFAEDYAGYPQISIHTPLAGSDLLPHGTPQIEDISIHTPLAGSDRRNETFLTK